MYSTFSLDTAHSPAPPLHFAPSPELTPTEVVIIQLGLLQNNDLMDNDEGIRAAFQFTSPVNRAQVGPVEQYIPLLKNSAYNAMIGFERAELGGLAVIGDTARQRVRLIKGGRAVSFAFLLRRQTDGYYNGCWMTDSVTREV